MRRTRKTLPVWDYPNMYTTSSSSGLCENSGGGLKRVGRDGCHREVVLLVVCPCHWKPFLPSVSLFASSGGNTRWRLPTNRYSIHREREAGFSVWKYTPTDYVYVCLRLIDFQFNKLLIINIFCIVNINLLPYLSKHPDLTLICYIKFDIKLLGSEFSEEVNVITPLKNYRKITRFLCLHQINTHFNSFSDIHNLSLSTRPSAKTVKYFKFVAVSLPRPHCLPQI